ncbi:MAG: anti-sigma factor [Proteobacteria bacterium]|nr:anti-sigma factor [Pseudomonadota bacterium]RPJ48670.1 MAG: zf-HC2 domain-containing protein [Betaproteobacteria bacterium]
MIPTCKETSVLLSQGQDRRLKPSESLRLRLHLLICRRCRSFSQQLEFLRAAVRRYRDHG